MLKNLSIRNYALIESLDLDFGTGLTIITGETGAGKSIMLGALALVMGGRADSKVISDSGSKSVVEATFTDTDPSLRPIFDQRGIDWIDDETGEGAELTVRREISASGRSKIYINDSAVTLQTLSLIASRLVDIHSQHANAEINDPSVRLGIIDAIAGNEECRERYHAMFREYADLTRRIRARKEQLEKLRENLEFMKFQYDQLSKLRPKRGELAEIERRFEMLSDADDIQERLGTLSHLLGDSDTGIQTLLAEASGLAGKVDFSLFEPEGEGDTAVGNPLEAPLGKEPELPITERLRLLLVEAKDIYETVEDFRAGVDTDPATLAKLSERMNLYYELTKRFRVKEADELADLFESLGQRLRDVALGDDELPDMEKKARRLAAVLKDQAEELSATRREGARKFSEMIIEKARPLGLKNLQFNAEVMRRKLTSSGQDEVEFLCSFNKSGTPRPLREIASGGEISRMMLSLKSILAEHMHLPTIIFDEVDTGVSGEIADKMGDMMRRMGERMQVLVITHLPQVAAKGAAHFKVYKTDEGARTVTHVRRLGDEERAGEIAAMISGSSVGEEALRAAKVLLGKQ